MKSQNLLRTLFCSMIALMTLLSFSSCTKEQPNPELKITQNLIEAAREGGEFTVPYELVNPMEGSVLKLKSDADWITDINVSDSEIKFKVMPNKTLEAREASFKFIYIGINSFPELKVRQEAALKPEITLYSEVVEIAGEGGNGFVNYTIANPIDGVNLKAETEEDWVNDLSVNMSNISFTLPASGIEEPREAIVNVTYEGAEQGASFKIIQAPGIVYKDETFSVGGVEFTMIYVEGGTFSMGATEEQGDDCYDFEKPVHQVTLSDYYVGQFEVTQELYEAVMGSNPSENGGNPTNPVECVSWEDANAFIAKLNELTGEKFDLPTEAQWEFAARGGNLSNKFKFSGGNDMKEVGWYGNNSDYHSHPVGEKLANELGIYDMSGNVWEWCKDVLVEYTEEAQTDPFFDEEGSSVRVRRGGSHYDMPSDCRISFRNTDYIDSRYGDLGLRLVMTR